MNQPSVRSHRRAALAALLALTPSLQLSPAAAEGGASKSPLKIHSASASSTLGSFTASKTMDGVISDESRWVSQGSAEPAWLELDLGAPQKLAGVHLYSGYQNASPIQSFVVQFWRDGAWRDIPSAAIANNRTTTLAIPFDDTVDVTTDKLRLWITASHQNIARVLEVVVWPAPVGNLPPLSASAAKAKPLLQDEPVPLIYLNQSGFNLGKPKRFTAPTLPDGTRFEVCPADGGPAVFSGTLLRRTGDFTGFDPADEREYVVVAGTNSSVPFRIGPWWLERVTYQNAVNFMVDSRHYVGNDRAVCGGSFGWRDDHHFGWELNTLVPQFLSNPSAYQRMPRQIQYEKPGNPKLWGALEPHREDAPDIVKLIHWGADVIVSQGLTHELLKAQLPYFLYAWADVVVRRSNNLWDFRKFDDGNRWTPMGNQPTMWNEPGNVLGLPAALLAAQPLLTNAATRARIEQLVWSHFDNGFGRNPVGRHFSYDAPLEIEGVEHGWFSFHPGGIGRLADARFVMDGSPKDGHYPYHPERGNYGWTEGWIQFNTAFNASLAYLAWANTCIELRRDGEELVVRVEAPLNFDHRKVETGKAWVTSSSGDQETVTVTEDSSNERTLTGRIRIASEAAARPGDGILQAAPGRRIEAGYGYGYLGRRGALKP